MVNIITMENLYNKKKCCDFYESIDTWIQTCNGFLYPLQGSISLFVQLCGKVVNSTFVISPTFDQFQMRLGLPWLTTMQAIASPINQCIKFPYDGDIKMINHSIYHPSKPQHCATLDFFWTSLPTPPPTQLDYMFDSYKEYKY